MAKYITIDEVVASAMTILAGSTDTEKVFMRHWCVLGNRELGLSKDNVVTDKINVQDFTIRKPENLLSIDDIGLYSDSDVEYATVYKGYGEMTITSEDIPNAGILFYQIQSNGQTETRKMISID